MAEVESSNERQRSPGYPSISLEEAIGRSRVLYEQDKLQAGSLEVIASHWNMSTKSSGFLQIIASLKRYGLLIELEGKPRKLKLTNDAATILMLSADDPKRKAAIQKVALTPKSFRDLWNTHGTDLPSDQNLQYELVTAGNFLHDAAADLIKQYKKTIAYAKLTESDKLKDSETKQDMFARSDRSDLLGLGKQQPASEQMVDTTQHQQPNPPPPLANIPAKAPEGQKDFPLYLSNNKRAVLFVPSSMTLKDYELLKRQIENHLMVIEATSITDDATKN